MGSILTFLGGVATWAVSQLTGVLSFLPSGAQLAVKAVAGLLTVLGIRSAATNPSQTVVDWLNNNVGKGWKTVVGALGAVLSYLLSPDAAGVLSANVSHILTVVFTALTALGLYHAQASAALKQ